MISGSTAPVQMLLLHWYYSTALLLLQWGATIYGIVTICFGDHVNGCRERRTYTYIIVGLLHAVFLTEYLRVLSAIELYTCGAIGLFYIVGGLVYAYEWPNPFPGFFGYHEIFHLLCLFSAIATFNLDVSVLKRTTTQYYSADPLVGAVLTPN
eukprot:GHVT01011082.1.p1 GENE.GHVT01011082.1~~GHVT01011082.1.p1  ORF type:complete len:153 (-),score=14.59 GHVT01011082.1:659-1117(-)